MNKRDLLLTENGKKQKFIDLMSDFGMKRVFGGEENKDALICLLNTIIKDVNIKEVTHLRNEQTPITIELKKTIFDLYCKTEGGEKIVIEVQRVSQPSFIDRALYYSTYPIIDQIKLGSKNYDLKRVFMICILEFDIPGINKPDVLYHRYRLRNDDGEVIPGDKLNIIFIEINKFNKSIDELELGNFEDYFYFCLKSMTELEEQPPKLKGGIFDKIFKSARLSTLNSNEYQQYIKAMYTELDKIGYREQGRIDGLKEGIEKGHITGLEAGRSETKTDIAKTMLANGYPKEEISKIVRIPLEEVEALMS